MFEFEVEIINDDIELPLTCNRSGCYNIALPDLKICQSCRDKIKAYNDLKYIRDKENILKRNKRYRENNPNYASEYCKQYRRENPEKAAQQTKNWRTKNKERSIEIIKNWNSNNPEKVKERYARYIKNHPEKIKSKNENYRKANAIKFVEYSAKRRAIKKLVTIEEVNYEEIYNRDNWTCQICKERIDITLKFPNPLSPSIDHIIPLSKGGLHSKTNLQAAHLKCNISKGAK